MQNKTFKIGFIGMGTVAQGVWKHLEKSFETMSARFGAKYELAKACVRDISKKRGVDIPLEKLTENPYDIVNDPSIDIVCELMGGTTDAFDITISALKAGAAVTHVDASKGMVLWAKENAMSSAVEKMPVRWLVDDCIKFVEREIRRGNHYDIIIMDPPSYGRGPGGEVWKLEDEVYHLCTLCKELLTDDSLLFLLNSYTTGLSPAVMQYILGSVIKPTFGGSVSADELGLPVTSTGLCLPCGSTAIWQK